MHGNTGGAQRLQELVERKWGAARGEAVARRFAHGAQDEPGAAERMAQRKSSRSNDDRAPREVSNVFFSNYDLRKLPHSLASNIRTSHVVFACSDRILTIGLASGATQTFPYKRRSGSPGTKFGRASVTNVGLMSCTLESSWSVWKLLW